MQLVALMQERYSIPSKQTIILLIELEQEGLLQFDDKQIPNPISLHDYVFSKKNMWYWGIIAIIVSSTVAFFAIPDSEYPLVYLRFVLGLPCILFLPGYTLNRLLFHKSSMNEAEKIERVALNIGISLTLTLIIGLFLNYTPWGIQLVPIVFSLLIVTLIFATVAEVREYQMSLL